MHVDMYVYICTHARIMYAIPACCILILSDGFQALPPKLGVMSIVMEAVANGDVKVKA